MKKRLDARQVYVIRELTAPGAGEQMPQVFIETIKGGEVVYGIRLQQRRGSFEKMRLEAERQFTALRKFVRDQKNEETRERLAESLEKQKEIARP